MSFKTRISDCGKYLHLIALQEINYSLAVQLVERAFSEAARHGIRNCFLDVRGCRNTASTSQNYKLVHEDIERIGFDHTWKFALLIDDHDDSHDFIGSAAMSAGFNYKLFTSEPALLEWIQI